MLHHPPAHICSPRGINKRKTSNRLLLAEAARKWSDWEATSARCQAPQGSMGGGNTGGWALGPGEKGRRHSGSHPRLNLRPLPHLLNHCSLDPQAIRTHTEFVKRSSGQSQYKEFKRKRLLGVSADGLLCQTLCLVH